MLGGMDRRGACLTKLRTSWQVVAVEGGDFVGGDGRQDELKARALLRMLGSLRYDAIGVGEKELGLGLERLMSLATASRVPFVSANIADAAGNPLFRSHVTVQRGTTGRRLTVAITSLLTPAAIEEAAVPTGEFTVTEPARAVSNVVRQTPAAHVRVLLFHGRLQEASKLARRVAGVHIILYAHGPDVPEPPIRAGGALLVYAGNRGKYLGLADLGRRDGKGASPRLLRYAPLSEGLGSDAAVQQIRRAYLDQVAKENLLGRLPRVPLPTGATYAGSEACVPCHAHAFAVWRKSSHSRAMHVLRQAHEDRDPECVPCHVTGMAYAGGYRPGDRHLESVGCESCHGPAAQHAKSASAPRPSRSGPEVCKGCHTADHSPAFRYEVYWNRVRHGPGH